MRAHYLLTAKAPVPGQVKTRLAAEVGPDAAAELAAYALLDTIAVLEAAGGRSRCHLALAGDLAEAPLGAEVGEAVARWSVRPQEGDGFAARLIDAHLNTPGPVVQVGMDTPQLTGAQLASVAAALDGSDAVLGPVADGGWWVLALRDPAHAACLADVEMSTPRTHDDTRAALESAGLTVATTAVLQDVDTAADAEAVAALAPGSRFGRAWLGGSWLDRAARDREDAR